MSQTHQQILQMHLAFMAELRKIEDVVTHENYEAIEKGYKDLAVLANRLAAYELIVTQLYQITPKSKTVTASKKLNKKGAK